jgi:SEC-C motif-containing protein
MGQHPGSIPLIPNKTLYANVTVKVERSISRMSITSELDKSEQKLTHLTPSAIQIQIADALSHGASVAAASRAAGISRTTFYKWYKSEPDFVAVIREAQAEYVRLIRDRVNRLSHKAIARLDALLDDPKTPPAVTLKTALAILERPTFSDIHWSLPEPAQVPPENLPENLTDEPVPPEAPASEPAQLARNAPCPCNSGLKFKRCCGQKAPGLVNPSAAARNSSPT